MADYSKLKALIVEDDPSNQLIAKTILSKIGITADVVNNGEEAIAILKGNDYSFALMDISMPGGPDGLDTGRWIREYSDSHDRHMPIFALTTFETKEHTKEIKNAGINEHIAKPLSLEKLTPLLKKYFWQKVGN